MWVVPDSAAVSKWTQPAPVKGLFSVLPRPEVVARTGYAPGILVSKDMDLVFMSALTAYPFNVDPWNPGEFRLPTDAAARGQDGHAEPRADHPGGGHHLAAPDLPRQLHRAGRRRRAVRGAAG